MRHITAVVLNWNGPEDTIRCVRSLRESAQPGLDVVVVDNASTDDSVTRFRSELPGVTIITRDSNGGYAAGNNEGIRSALARGADYVLVVNNDVVVTRGFLEPMLAEAEADPRVGVVTCDARFESDHDRSYPTGGTLSWWRGAGVALPRSSREQRKVVDFVSGCILLVRREVFEKVGYFDESFFMYFEDVDFSRRVARAFQIVYTPRAMVYHRSGGGDAWSRQTTTYLYYMARNRVRAFRDRSVAYRAYLVLVSFVAAVAKSLAILLRGSRREQQLGALWSGFAAATRP
jgi:GT2 family glycosyltransferase